MDRQSLAFDAPIERYDEQAARLLDAHHAGEREALRFFHEKHPRFLDSEVKWLARRDLTEADIRDAALELDDARLAVARGYDFRDWAALADYAAAVAVEGSPVRRFERAVEAVIHGELDALEAMLRAQPELVRARSTRVTHFDPPVHRATLLHYLAANGVEGYRQRSPQNAVAIARALLQAGAEPDALAGMYGGECTTMSMLVSSTPPAEVGVQVALVEVLVDFGAAVEPRGAGAWTSPLMTALVFGFRDAAEALVRRGASVAELAAAAGLDRRELVARLLPSATPESRHRALALAAQLGRADVVRLLLDAGEDPNRYNPDGFHAHGTPLHHAISGGHDAVVRLLVERGARLDIADRIYEGTPLGWAEYCGKTELARYLRARGAPR